MRRVLALGAGLLAALGLGVPAAHAEQPRDYFLDAPTAGTFAHLDAYTIGAQASLENRADLEPGMSMLHTRLSGIASYPYADGSLNMDARLFLFTLGGSLGYRYTYRDHTFKPGEDRSRDARNDREKAGDYGTQGFPYYEGRLRLVIPLRSPFCRNVRIRSRRPVNILCG